MKEAMRDHFEDTPFDMTQDVGAGPFKVPYRFRPMSFEVDGKSYCMERAIATQQTGFTLVGQMRNWLPDPVGGVLWFESMMPIHVFISRCIVVLHRFPNVLVRRMDRCMISHGPRLFGFIIGWRIWLMLVMSL